MYLNLQISNNGQWQDAAILELTGELPQGLKASTILQYQIDYASSNLNSNDSRALSLNEVVNFSPKNKNTFPAFCFDIIPAGRAKEFWLDRLDLEDRPSSNWELLKLGAMTPPGNIRVKEAYETLVQMDHPGFSKDDVIRMKEEFIDHAEKCGAPISGSSGANGEAKKFLLTEDIHGRFHPTGIIPLEKRKKEWIIKFPRDKYDEDLEVLRAEDYFHKIAMNLNLKTFGETSFSERCLFVERFDVFYESSIENRYGLESIASAMNIAQFGKSLIHFDVIKNLKEHSTSYEADLLEYFKRDLLNLTMGNHDNHSRNTSYLKKNNEITLSPLYDFCPMFLDSTGVSRTIRWGECEENKDVNWNRVFSQLIELKLLRPENKEMLISSLIEMLENLPGVMKSYDIYEEITDYITPRREKNLGGLENAQKR
ncbi:HipA domain-containing protein [Halobacteriovorax sp. JY17]|uniref:HipA domain-containing protein n=1 Tax=Halobacteriovorax sp. JY17 TaxID=2014617 RepID=UPI000C49C428|nr:HipA domain-containing protein [Halobacteriovorax sp. JY17]PIK14657.1 MAG: hypothetical protein CES88_09975 [Halobacteriovorax sp. JY17]